MINKNRTIAKILVIIIFLSALAKPTIILAADATDYDFTDELNTSRTGIGFRWTAETRTLTITGIKNSNAEIKLPDNSIIDIQGNGINTVKNIKCSNGSLTIKGNDVANLNISETAKGSGTIMGIYAKDTLTIDSGIINITSIADNDDSSRAFSYGIHASKIIINNGNINVEAKTEGKNTASNSYAIYTENIVINNGTVKLKSGNDAISLGILSKRPITEINGGDIQISFSFGYGITGESIINGGNVCVTCKIGTSLGKAFENVPSINPECNWDISYGYKTSNAENSEVYKPSDITNIYNIFDKYEIIKIVCQSDGTIHTNTHNATDYDFTDELNASRTGIGFRWTAETRTLTITGIKNSNAEIKLPDNSIIDIQGNGINTVKNIKCSNGSLTIKGNDVANLNISETAEGSGPIMGIYAKDTLTIDSGIINITSIAYNDDSSRAFSYGIYAPKIIINNGNINVEAKTEGKNTISNSYAINTENIVINDGTVKLKSVNDGISLGLSSKRPITEINGGDTQINFSFGYGITGNPIINGGNVCVTCNTGGNVGKAFENVPSINPEIQWIVKYKNAVNSTAKEYETDITDIYNIYNLAMVKLLSDIPATGITEITGKNEIGIGEKTTFAVTLEPSYTTSEVTWSSSNEKVAKVSSNGEITGIGFGTATITATANGLSARKDINVKCKITLDPNGVNGIEKIVVYTNMEGKLEKLPTLFNDKNIFNKWIDQNGKEVTIDTVFNTNATIYANWTSKTILVGEQKNIAKYGEATIVNYDITSNFNGTYTVKIENLPDGVTLENNNLKFQEIANGKYRGTIGLNISNTAQATNITNLKIIINDSIISNDFKIQIDKANSMYEKVPIAKTIEYNEKEQYLIEAGTTKDGIIQYSIDGINFVATIPKAKQVGNYNVYYRIIGDNNHLNSNVSMLKVTITNPKTDYLLGDVNGDGTVNSQDAVMILKYVAHNIELTEKQLLAANTTKDKDGTVNAQDAVQILKYVAHNISEF